MELSEEFITASQAAKLTGYNPDYFSSLIRDGKVRGKKMGKSWITTRKEVERFLKNIKKTPRSTWSSHIGLNLKSVIVAFCVAVLLSIACYSVYAAVYNTAWNQVAAVASISTTTASQFQP